jgi:hypothetical protein
MVGVGVLEHQVCLQGIVPGDKGWEFPELVFCNSDSDGQVDLDILVRIGRVEVGYCECGRHDLRVRVEVKLKVVCLSVVSCTIAAPI